MARGSRGRRFEAAAICVPGLEDLCADELRALGCRPRPAGPGTVDFSASARQLYAANVWLRTASRVLVRIATFRATDFPHLQDGAAGIDWTPWIGDGMAPAFRVTTNESKLYHTSAIAQRLHQVVGPPSTGEPEQAFVVRIDRNTVTISADSSGQPLHHRPWRTEQGSAPLRTTMAAALLLATEWDRESGPDRPLLWCRHDRDRGRPPGPGPASGGHPALRLSSGGRRSSPAPGPASPPT